MTRRQNKIWISLSIAIAFIAFFAFIVIQCEKNGREMKARWLKEEQAGYSVWVKVTGRSDITFQEWEYLKKYNCLSTVKENKNFETKAEQ